MTSFLYKQINNKENYSYNFSKSNLKENREIENYHWAHITVTMFAGKTHQWILKLVSKTLRIKRIHIV